MTVKVHVEGGGSRREANARCREGFRVFFHRAGLDPRSLRVIPGGARAETYKSFRDDVKAGHGDFAVLLVDSEGALRGSSVWEHLRATDGWTRPDDSPEDHAHLMVQCMEAWLVADREALAAFYGPGFNPGAIPTRTDVEDTPISDLLGGLRKATRRCRKGSYSKGKHSFEVLAKLDPQKVMAAAPHAERLIKTLRRRGSART